MSDASQFCPNCESLAAEIERLREALRFYANWHPRPSEGPWGASSTDFGEVARAALKGNQ